MEAKSQLPAEPAWSPVCTELVSVWLKLCRSLMSIKKGGASSRAALALLGLLPNKEAAWGKEKRNTDLTKDFIQ